MAAIILSTCSIDVISSTAFRLSNVSAYLQHPKSLDADSEYHNLRFLTFADENLNVGDVIGIKNDSLWDSENQDFRKYLELRQMC